jgi:hypothetical protein
MKSAIAALAITLVPQGVWSALILANLRTVPAIPWSVVVMTVLLVAGTQYLRGRWGSPATAATRRQSLRATVVSREMFAWAWLAGALSIIALSGAWIVLAALLPHPPAGVAFGPKVMFFFLAGLIFSTMAYLTNSILPAIPIHGLGLLLFFLLIWPNDPARPLVGASGTDSWFWIHVAQVVVFTALAVWAFSRLARLHNVVARKL